jgi:hypothetical protein
VNGLPTSALWNQGQHPVRQGLRAGAIATSAEAFWSRAQPRLLGGRTPIFDTTVMASALITRWTGKAPTHRLAHASGTAMRCAYGPTWAMVWAVVLRRTRRRTTLCTATLLALMIWSTELLLLPRIGAAPPVRRWAPVDVLLDASNAALYSAVVSVALSDAGIPGGRP